METDEARESGDAEEWAPALQAYHATEGKRTAEADLARKRSGESATPSVEEGELRGENNEDRRRGERKRAREE